MRLIFIVREIEFMFDKKWYTTREYDYEDEHVKLLDIGSFVIGYAIKNEADKFKY